jgi:drug/metabolite transporter (DMT)-like permease
MRPGFRGIEIGHIAAILSAFCIGTSIVCLRLLGNTERRVTIFAMLNLVNLVAVLPLMLWQGVQMPDLREWALLLLCGVTAGIGQLLLMAATRRAPANRIAPAQYSQLLWAVVFGALLFAEFPDGWTAGGMLLIAASGLFLIQRRPKQAVVVPGPLP